MASPASSQTERRAPTSTPASCPTDSLLLPSGHRKPGSRPWEVSANPLIARGKNFARGFETFVESGWDNKIRNGPAAAEINETLLRWLRENRRGRFFAYVHYMDVHDPYTPPARVRPPPPPNARKAVIAGDVESVAQKLDGTGGVVLTYLRALYDAEVRARLGRRPRTPPRWPFRPRSTRLHRGGGDRGPWGGVPRARPAQARGSPL